MKKKWLKRAMSAGLALLMAVGLSACGGSSGKNKGSDNSALAKENVYRLNAVDVPQFFEEEEEGYVNACCSLRKDGRVYVLLQLQSWYRDAGEQMELKLMSIKEDGSDIQFMDLELPDADNPQDTAEPDEAASEPAGDEAASEPAEDEAASEPADEYSQNIYENNWYSNFIMTRDGRVYGVRQHSFEDYSDPEAYVSENNYYLCCWDLSGSFQWEAKLENLCSNQDSEEYIYLQNIAAAADGSLNLILMGENAYKMNVSADGVVSAKSQLSGETFTKLSNMRNLIAREDGSFFAIYSDENDWTKEFITDYNLESDTFGDPVELPGALLMNGYNTMAEGIDSDLIYTNSNGVYSYNKGDTEGKQRMDFVNSDVNITSIFSFIELDDKSFLGVYNEDYEGELKAAVFTYVDPKDIPDKTVLVVAGNYIDGDMKKRAIEYNRANDTYRIVLKDYSSYNTYESYDAGYVKLNNDIITGGMPDILIADQLPVDNYISKGLIADVGRLIEEDEELSQVEYMQNVFDAFSVDGTLYYVIPQFSVATMAAKESLVGDGSDWSMEKMKQIVSEMGEGAMAFSDVTREGFMSMALQFCGRDFIDVETGKCAFDSEDFISMMEFAKTLPEEINWDEIYGEEGFGYESQYRDNKTLLMQTYMGSFDNLSYQLNGYLGGEFTFVGFPTEEGNGSYINASLSMVLSAKSKNLDGAWDFVRYYLTDEYQESLEYMLPVNKKLFLEQSKKAMERPYYMDYETQEKVEYDQTFYVNGEEIVIPPLSQEQLDKVLQFMETVDNSYYYNQDILNIINEEMGSFYSGQKTARDVAAVIQSRAQLYVEENR